MPVNLRDDAEELAFVLVTLVIMSWWWVPYVELVLLELVLRSPHTTGAALDRARKVLEGPEYGNAS